MIDVRSPTPVATAYDSFPCRTQARRRTDPNRLAALATLFGLEPRRVADTRVLELGCGTGDNIAAIAAALPDAECLGIELSANRIEFGRRRAEAAGLANLRLTVGDLRRLDPAPGRFDYLIAHGVLSWILVAAHGEFFAACKRHLVPTGIACVSYNTFPGWHLRAIVRDLMLAAGGEEQDPRRRVERARAALDRLADALKDTDTSYGAFVQEQRTNVRQLADHHLAHDLLEADNEPLYFRDFVTRASQAGLRYVAEAALDWMVADNYPQPVTTVLRTEPDLIRREQLLDFLINRTFRESLLCHGDRSVAAAPLPHRMVGLHFAGSLRSELSILDPHQGGSALFLSAGGIRISIEGAVNQMAILHLIERYPEPLMMTDLIDAARRRLGRDIADTEIVDLTRTLYAAYSRGLIDLLSAPSRLVVEPGAKPHASDWARVQFRDDSVVATLLFDNVNVDDDACRTLLPLLDGTRDRGALTAELQRLSRPHEPAAEIVDAALARLGRVGLMVA
ncbi:MAG: methyltransferase domain-containing protein [Alphaproteobacteria bacterium]|nr:methyltransferase domain-containing protein [Alphaproteobacteria bacterium]